jgi:hypothetical protein
MMRYGAVQQLVAAAESQARALGANLDGRMAVYVMALTSLHLAFSPDESEPAPTYHGWERMVKLLANPSERLPVDALESSPMEQARRRLELIAAIPEITGVTDPQELAALIGEAINRGAPLYNIGDARSCDALYWTYARLIYETPATRGFPGYARLQADLKPLAEAAAYPDRLNDAQVDHWAWDLRHALDSAARAVASA